ncbi:MAG: hypothetical protein ACK5XN_15190, partial [Bacteroidota bacterium]
TKVNYIILTDSNESSTEDNVKRIETRGRKSKLGIPTDGKYSTAYYQATKTIIRCECGAVMNKRCFNRHLKCPAHILNMEARQEIKTQL